MSDYSKLIEIFEKLVGFRTVTGDAEAAAACLNYAEKILDCCGLQINRFSCNGFESLVATTQNTKSPKLLFQAHLDVVPANEPLYRLRREGSKLIGRGAFDMKYAAACFLHLMQELGDSRGDYDIGIMLTTDEELSGENGVSYLLDQGYSCEVCILPDGGDNWRVETAAKGAWHVDTVALGKTAHGSRPWDGDNAAVRLLHFLTAVDSLVPQTTHIDTTIVISRLRAGHAANQVPDEATASLDIRFLDHTSYVEVRTALVALAKLHAVELRNELLINAIDLDVTLPAVQQWEQIVADVRGSQARDGYALSFGASDARFFHARGIPAIVTRPDGGGMHGDDEWIDEAGLYQFAECLRRYAEQVATSAQPKPESI